MSPIRSAQNNHDNGLFSMSMNSGGKAGFRIGDNSVRTDGTATFGISDRVDIGTDGTAGFKINERFTIRTDGTFDLTF